MQKKRSHAAEKTAHFSRHAVLFVLLTCLFLVLVFQMIYTNFFCEDGVYYSCMLHLLARVK